MKHFLGCLLFFIPCVLLFNVCSFDVSNTNLQSKIKKSIKNIRGVGVSTFDGTVQIQVLLVDLLVSFYLSIQSHVTLTHYVKHLN